jgi:hypothetical protein
MNPFPKPPSGSYKQPLFQGLRNIGRTKEVEAFESRSISIGIKASITGAVKTLPELTSVLIQALESVEQNDVVKYYIHELKAGNVITCSNDGAYVYDPEDKAAVAYVQQRLKEDDEKVFKSGELFFKS